jgi:hypothetical protein
MAGFQAQLYNGGSAALDADDFVLYTGGTDHPDGDEPPRRPAAAATPTAATRRSSWSPRPTHAPSQTSRRRQAVTGRIESSSTGRDQRAIINVVDLYVSPFGEQRVVLNRFLKAKNTLVFDPSMWKKVNYRNWFRETLAKTGDNTTMMVVGEFSLKHRNKQASAAIVEAAGATGF